MMQTAHTMRRRRTALAVKIGRGSKRKFEGVDLPVRFSRCARRYVQRRIIVGTSFFRDYQDKFNPSFASNRE
jgi:hypothetical protein